MKDKKRNVIIVSLVVILAIIVAVVLFFNKCNSCNFVPGTGKIIKTTKVDKTDLSKFNFSLYKDKGMIISNDNISSAKLYEYKMITSINHKKDVSVWTGCKLVDLAKAFDIKLDDIYVSSSKSGRVQEYDNLNNVYVLFKKDGNSIGFEGGNILILADITKDSSEWFYNFEMILDK